ncbi:14656_t:CDS:1, partial [Rhizophagus irregularis]
EIEENKVEILRRGSSIKNTSEKNQISDESETPEKVPSSEILNEKEEIEVEFRLILKIWDK